MARGKTRKGGRSVNRTDRRDSHQRRRDVFTHMPDGAEAARRQDLRLDRIVDQERERANRAERLAEAERQLALIDAVIAKQEARQVRSVEMQRRRRVVEQLVADRLRDLAEYERLMTTPPVPREREAIHRTGREERLELGWRHYLTPPTDVLERQPHL